MIGVWNSVKPCVPHPVADDAHHVRAQHHVLMQLLAAQVEEAVGQPGFLGVVRIAEDRHRQLLGGAQHRQSRRIDLDLAGGELRVDQRRVARLHPSVDADHPFGPHRFRSRQRRGCRRRQITWVMP